MTREEQDRNEERAIRAALNFLVQDGATTALVVVRDGHATVNLPAQTLLSALAAAAV